MGPSLLLRDPLFQLAALLRSTRCFPNLSRLAAGCQPTTWSVDIRGWVGLGGHTSDCGRDLLELVLIRSMHICL